MDCTAFFETATAELAELAGDPTRSTPGGQCVYEFYHPRIQERFGDQGLATSFNRSGVVWSPVGRQLGVKIRVPDAHGDAVADALADAPLEFEQTDHRGAAAPDGEMVTVLHFAARASDVSTDATAATLAAVAAALAV